MAIQMNQAFKNEVLFTRGIIDLLYYGVIRVYSGTQPVNPNDAPTGTQLGQITTDGNAWTPGQSAGGLRLSPVPGYSLISKPQIDPWVLSVSSSGTAGWWRFIADANTSAWIDGAVTGPFIELFLGDPVLTALEQRQIEFFQIGFYW